MLFISAPTSATDIFPVFSLHLDVATYCNCFNVSPYSLLSCTNGSIYHFFNTCTRAWIFQMKLLLNRTNWKKMKFWKTYLDTWKERTEWAKWYHKNNLKPSCDNWYILGNLAHGEGRSMLEPFRPMFLKLPWTTWIWHVHIYLFIYIYISCGHAVTFLPEISRHFESSCAPETFQLPVRTVIHREFKNYQISRLFTFVPKRIIHREDKLFRFDWILNTICISLFFQYTHMRCSFPR